jgi:chloramphenicol 3-O-phosphotransferase
MVEAAGALVSTGNNLIFDDMILSTEHWVLWQSVLGELDATVVRLDAPAPILKMREVARGREEKYHGLALGHYLSNKVPLVDFEIDTSQMSVEAAIKKIEARVGSGT